MKATAKTGKEIIAENGYAKSVSPLLRTSWQQDKGENAMLPFISQASTTRVKTGCGATALGQIMKRWNYPDNGSSDNFYEWMDEDSVCHILRHADFAGTKYDWANMAEDYANGHSVSQRQRDAVATLMHDLGVALEMRYNKDGGATQIEYVATILKKHFGYHENLHIVRQMYFSIDEWRSMIYRELSAGRPVFMGGTHLKANGGTSNHMFVADGYDENGLVHLNMGHGPGETRYYDLTQQDVSYLRDMRMILGICPKEERLDLETKTVEVATPGTLGQILGDGIYRTWKLKITGKINKDDLAAIANVSKITTGQLFYLDLSGCSVVNDEIPQNIFSSCYTLQVVILPKSLRTIGARAFGSCRGLYKVVLPDGLVTLEDRCFNDCRYLAEIRLPHSVRQVSNPFNMVKLDRFKVDDGNTSFMSRNGALLTADGKTMLSLPQKAGNEFVVPRGVEEIIDGGVGLNCCLTSRIVFPRSTRRIYWPFDRCYSMADVVCRAQVPPVLLSRFASPLDNVTLHVPTGCSEEYRNNGWDCFTNIVEDVATSFADLIDDMELAEVTDLVQTAWPSGANAFSKVFPSAGGVTASPTTVALAMAQVMNFFQYPEMGKGRLSFACPNDRDEPLAFSADFSRKIDWQAIAGTSPLEVSDEAARLVHDCAAATFYKRMPAKKDRGSQLQHGATAMKKFFGYNRNMRILNASNYDQKTWMGIIYSELSEGRPVMAEWLNNDKDMVYVLCGYDEHGNLWLLDDKAKSLVGPEDGRVWSPDIHILVDIVPCQRDLDMNEIFLDTPGSLRERLGDNMATVAALRLGGPLDQGDMAALKEMARMEGGQLMRLDLSGATLPSGELQDYAFQDCDMLQYVTLPDNLKRVGRHAFSYCYNLLSVEQTDQLAAIRSYAFFFCRYLDGFRLGDGVALGTNPFAYNKISDMTASGNYAFSDGLLKDGSGKAVVCASGTMEGDYSIPDGITDIAMMAFRGCDGIKSLTIHAEVKTIPEYSFYECHQLKDVYCLATTAPELEYQESVYAFFPECSYCTLHVPQGCAEEYRKNGWGRFRSIIDDLPNGTGYSPLLGDADGNGVVNVVDVMMIVDHILNRHDSKFVFANADLDGNGTVDVADAMGVVNIILHKHDCPPFPDREALPSLAKSAMACQCVLQDANK